MSNFSPKLQEATEEELMYMVNELDFRVVPLASDELTRRTIRKFESTIKKEIRTNEKLSHIFKILAFVQIIIAILQFGFSIVEAETNLLRIVGVIFLATCGVIIYNLFKEIPSDSKE